MNFDSSMFRDPNISAATGVELPMYINWDTVSMRKGGSVISYIQMTTARFTKTDTIETWSREECKGEECLILLINVHVIN